MSLLRPDSRQKIDSEESSTWPQGKLSALLEPVMNFVSASQLESVNGVDDLALKKDCSAPKTASAVAQEGFTWENRSYSGKFDF